MKTAFVSMLLSTILGVTAAAAATSPFTFGTTTVSVKVTPHATTVWIVNYSGTQVITDTDGDGIVTFDTGQPIDPYLVYAVADLSAGTILRGSQSGYGLYAAAPSNLVQLAPDGTLSRLVLPQRGASVLWMRPGVGAWRYLAGDNGDDDHVSDGRTQALTGSFWRAWGGGAPATFAPGDVIFSESVVEDYYHTPTVAILETLSSPLAPPSGAGSIELYREMKPEGATNSLVFLRVNGADGTLSLDYKTADDTAKAGLDYQPISGTLTFGPGEFEKTVYLSTIDDALYEGDRTVDIVTSIPVNPDRYYPSTTITPVKILDNEPPPVVTCASLVAFEGDGPQSASFKVNLTGATRVPANVAWALSDVNNGPSLAHGTLTFMPGETTKTIPFSWTGNTVPNYDRIIGLSLNGTGCTIAPGDITLTIKDDDPPVLSLAGDVTTLEGPSGWTVPVDFEVDLSAAVSPQVTVDYRTVDGTAVAGKDYVAKSGTLTFTPGLKTQHVDVSVIGNDTPEPDKTFTFVLSNPQHALLGARPSAMATIRNDDGPVVILTVLPITVAEGNGGQSTATFTATLSAAATAVVHVDWHTVDGTALAGRDYIAASGSFDFRPGETTKVFDVAIVGNTIPQPDRTFSVAISATNVFSFTPAATCRIVDDDSGTPAVVISDASLVRGTPGTTSTLSATVQLSVASSSTVSVHYATSDGTAAASRDYIAAVGDLTFAPGQTMKTIPVTVNGSATTADETFTIVLSRPVNATLVDAVAKCTIVAAKQAPPAETHHRAAHH